jgi:hypothetical protein
LSTKAVVAVVAHLHDIMLYEVESAGKCTEFHAVKVYIVGGLERPINNVPTGRVKGRMEYRNDVLW